MLKPVRIDAGLGDPPGEYTNNDTESANFMIKYALEFNPKEPCEFIEDIKEVIDSQFRNEDRAVFNKGDYRISAEFQHLAIDDEKWSKMTHGQRQAHILKFAKTGMSGRKTIVEDVLSTQHSAETKAATGLSINASESGITSVPFPILEKMFEKADQLINKEGLVVPQPGATNGSFIVAGYGNKFYSITPGKGGSISCDRTCIHRSSKICEHVLAVAEKRKTLKEFVAWYKRSKNRPSLIGMATTAAPANAGKKPSLRKRTNKKKETATVLVDIFDSNEDTSLTGAQPRQKGCKQQVEQPLQQPQHLSQEMPQQQISNCPGPFSNLQQREQMASIYLQNNPLSMFSLKWLPGTTVSKCYGCNGKIVNPPVRLPDDIVLVHRDIRTYRNPRTGQLATSQEPQNVNFHMRLACILKKYPSFKPTQHLFIQREFVPFLQPEHFHCLATEFGWRISA